MPKDRKQETKEDEEIEKKKKTKNGSQNSLYTKVLYEMRLPYHITYKQAQSR